MLLVVVMFLPNGILGGLTAEQLEGFELGVARIEERRERRLIRPICGQSNDRALLCREND